MVEQGAVTHEKVHEYGWNGGRTAGGGPTLLICAEQHDCLLLHNLKADREINLPYSNPNNNAFREFTHTRTEKSKRQPEQSVQPPLFLLISSTLGSSDILRDSGLVPTAWERDWAVMEWRKRVMVRGEAEGAHGCWS